MKKRKGSSSPRGGDASSSQKTRINASFDSIVEGVSSGELESLGQALSAIRLAFDPAAVTMSSTNLPDAVLKLSQVLTEASEAAQKVFRLVEAQKELLLEGERCLTDLEKLAREPQGSADAALKLVATYQGINRNLSAVGHEIVMAQEFEDLSGQKIKKVLRLLCDMECSLRSLLQQFKIEIPSAQSVGEPGEDGDIDQDAANRILKDLGF